MRASDVVADMTLLVDEPVGDRTVVDVDAEEAVGEE